MKYDYKLFFGFQIINNLKCLLIDRKKIKKNFIIRLFF